VPTLDDLLTRGYFPKELPPPFKTVSFATKVAEKFPVLVGLAKGLPPTKLAQHNLARPGSIHRRLGIPNPAPHLMLCAFLVKHWPGFQLHFAKSKLSLSLPEDSPAGRAVNTRVPLGELAEHRVAVRAGYRASLYADVARFYPSLYTHSIPWALHTKAVAKANKGPDLVGNVLDKLVRAGQDGQTIGIPIGPDTSLIIAELILSSIDEQIQLKVKAPGYRYLDDFEFVFPSTAAAEGALGPLQEILGHNELALNPEKTFVLSLPQPSEEQWIPRLREFRIRKDKSPQRRDLLTYFDLAFELSRTFRLKTVLNYAVAGLRSVILDPSNVNLAQDLVLQSVVNEAGVARFGFEMLIRWRASGWPLDYEKIRLAIETMVRYHAPLMQGSEVAWALWGGQAFGLELSGDVIQAALRMDDPIVSLLCLDLEHRDLTGFGVSAHLSAEIGRDSLGSQRWLLLYEGVRRGWLPKKLIENDVFKPFFDFLSKNGVSFYDSESELLKISRPIDEINAINLPVVGFVFGY
jgi:hypothetical protein